MADDKKDDNASKDEGKLTVAHLRTLIREEIGHLIPSGVGSTEKPDKTDEKPPTPDLKTLVQTELGKLRAREQREKRDQEIDERLKTLEQPQEKAPVERSRWHKIMGWGEPE